MDYNIKLAILKKDICKRCFLKYGREWDSFSELYWLGVMSFHKYGKIIPVVYCSIVKDSDGKFRGIPIDKGIPIDCPYSLEHLMENQDENCIE